MSRYTQQAIMQSFRNQLAQKPINKITVADIAQESGINRQTFYYHYRDIYELAQQVCEADMQTILKGRRHYDSWQEDFAAIFELAISKKIYVENIFRGIPAETLQQAMYRMVFPLVMDVVDEKAELYAVTEEGKKGIASFYNCALVGLFMEWVRLGMAEEPGKIVRRVSAILDGTLEHALKILQTQESVCDVQND